VLDALLDAGAEIDVTGAVIAGGAPLEDAVAFGQWNAARRLVERGATVAFREAAALGSTDAVSGQPGAADAGEISMAFWYACHGGQRPTAELLLDRGAQLDWADLSGLLQCGPDPLLGRKWRGALRGAVDPALETEVGALGRRRVHVAPVDAHGRRSEEALALRGFDGFDSPQS